MAGTARPARAPEATMPLQQPMPTPDSQRLPAPAARTPAPAGRDALLAMTWAAWCSTLPDVDRGRLVAAVAGRPGADAGAATVASEVSLKLLRLRRIAADDPETLATVAGLRDDHPASSLPRPLVDVLAASDEDRAALLARARAEAQQLPMTAAAAQAAVIAYLIGTALDPGTGALVERATDRGRVRAVLQALGLPFTSYVPQLRAWV